MNDALGSVQSALILGGGSDIALATARALVRSRCRTVVLAGRDPESFAPAAKELLALGATTVECVEFDALALDTHAAFVASVFERFGDIDLVLVAFGVLGDQDAAERDARRGRAHRRDELHRRGLGAGAARAGHAPPGPRPHRRPLVGRRRAGPPKSNFVYGSSKAGLDAFCQGLGDSLQGSGVRVLVVRPGSSTRR